jgi:hypothetical protein
MLRFLAAALYWFVGGIGVSGVSAKEAGQPVGADR